MVPSPIRPELRYREDCVPPRHDPGPRDQYHRAFACFCPRPATLQKLDFLFAADHRRARKGERKVTRLGDAALTGLGEPRKHFVEATNGRFRRAFARSNLGSISKQGDRYLGGLFTVGALAVIRYAK